MGSAKDSRTSGASDGPGIGAGAGAGASALADSRGAACSSITSAAPRGSASQRLWTRTSGSRVRATRRSGVSARRSRARMGVSSSSRAAFGSTRLAFGSTTSRRAAAASCSRRWFVSPSVTIRSRVAAAPGSTEIDSTRVGRRIVAGFAGLAGARGAATGGGVASGTSRAERTAGTLAGPFGAETKSAAPTARTARPAVRTSARRKARAGLGARRAVASRRVGTRSSTRTPRMRRDPPRRRSASTSTSSTRLMPRSPGVRPSPRARRAAP